MDPELLAAILATMTATAAGGSFAQLVVRWFKDRRARATASKMATSDDSVLRSVAIDGGTVESLLQAAAEQGWSVEHSKRLFEAVVEANPQEPARRLRVLSVADWQSLDNTI